MRILKDSQSIFASRPTGIVKCSKRTDNKFGYINSHNASGQLPVILPVPEPDPELPAETTPPSSPVNGTPCSYPLGSGSGEGVYLNGVCTAKPSSEPKDEPTPQKDADESTQQLIIYAIGGLIGGAGGYLVANKYKKNIYGGLLLGVGIATGGVYLYFNGKVLMDKFKNRGRVGSDDTKSGATGRTAPNSNGSGASSSRAKGRKCRHLNPDGTTTVYECPKGAVMN